MTIKINKDGSNVTFIIGGRLDTVAAPSFDAAIKENINDANEVVIDMNNIEYVSSAGLRVLLSTQKVMNKRGGMKLLGVCEDVLEVLELTGFADIFVIE